jgi:signal transduction histidine kinase
VNSENELAEQVSIRDNKLTLVERLADDLAHEIKNPLHSMVINLEVLRRRIARLENSPNEELLRYAGILSTELERVNQRVDLLLRMVRPARDPGEPSSIGEIIEELRDLVQLECERHEVELVLDVPRGLARDAFPRPALRQLVLSLVLQALESLPAGGALRIATEVDGAEIRIHFQPRPGRRGETSRGRGNARDDGALLSVAHVLAEQLGGEIAVAHENADDPSDPASIPEGYLLRLPRSD